MIEEDVEEENSAIEAVNGSPLIEKTEEQEQMQLEIFTERTLEPVVEEKQYISLDEAIAQGKQELLSIETRITDLYGEYFANRRFSYTAKEVIANFEEYIQALLLVACMEGRDLQEDEMRFIWSVLSQADVFAGTDSIEGALEKAKGIIKTSPHAILISIAVDKYYEKSETKFILNGIYAIYKTTCSLANMVAVKKEKLLASVIAFAKSQGVKL